MKTQMRRTLSGPIRTQDMGGGLWHLTVDVPDATQVYLRIAPGTNCAALQYPGIQRLDVHWLAEGVTVRVTGADDVGLLQAASAIVHEAKSRLYDGLPLMGFDAKARRFWKRVFFLIGIPGGRYLLRLIARRRR